MGIGKILQRHERKSYERFETGATPAKQSADAEGSLFFANLVAAELPAWSNLPPSPKVATPRCAVQQVTAPDKSVPPPFSLIAPSLLAEQCFTYPLPQGRKARGELYHTVRNSMPIAWRVAVLWGGQHGPYRLAQTLRGAHGTYGKLRLGVDAQGTPVAVKVVRLKHKAGGATRHTPLARVLDELNAAVQAGPEHRALDVLQVRDKVYIAMPLAGGDLFDLRHARDHYGRRIESDERALLARHLLAHASTALQRMHAKGWAHLDLKLENFLWSDDGSVRLTDFGLASQDFAHAGGRGTAHTMAPEAAAHEYTDGRADVWSLGVTVAEVLARSGQIFTQVWDRHGQKHVQGHPERVLRNQIVFSSWHSSLPRLASGSIDLDSIDPRRELTPLKQSFAMHFAEVRDADPEMCQFILQFMLRVVARERLSMHQVAQCVAPHAEYLSASQPELAEIMRARAPARQQRQNVLNLLQDVHRGVAWVYKKDQE